MPEPERPILAGGEKLKFEALRTRGFGDKHHPISLPEARQALLPQLQLAQQQASDMPEHLRGRRVVVEAKVLPNYMSASDFPKKLLDLADVRYVGARTSTGIYRTESKPEGTDQTTKVLLLAAGAQELGYLADMLGNVTPSDDIAKALEFFREFEEIRLPTSDDVLRDVPPNGEESVWEAVLHPGMDPADTASIFEKWEALVAANDGEVITRHRRVVGGLTFVPVRLTFDHLSDVTVFNPLRVLRPAAKLAHVPLRFRRHTGENPVVGVPEGTTARSDLKVAVFDGGVRTGCPNLDPYVTVIHATPEPEDEEAVDHGTAVTSTVLYGDVAPGTALTAPSARVDHYRIDPWPDAERDFEAYWVLEEIENAVRAVDYDVVNLSFGPDRAITDDEPHAWTSTLDMLARETRTLFAVAVGNNGERDEPHGRVQVPSDAVNAIGVGACDQRAPVSPWGRTVYSARGPGRTGSRVRPTGVAFGGTPESPFPCLMTNGEVAYECGTSLATPLTVHGLANLSATMPGIRLSTNALRAFAIHFAERSDHSREDVGYGRFQTDYADALDCAPNRTTVVYVDSLVRHEDQGVSLPVPSGLPAGARINVRWTLCFTSPVDPMAPIDYSLQGITHEFRPHSQRFRFTDPKRRNWHEDVDLDVDPERAVELIRAGAVRASLPITRPVKRIVANEKLLREEGKWETIIHASDSLQARSMKQPMITMSYLARQAGVLVSDNIPDLDYVMLVTVEAARKDIDLYTPVRDQFEVLTPIRAQLPVRARV